MPGMDKPTGRVVALIVLLIVVAAALRGYLPAQDRAVRAEPGSGRAALTFVVAALAGSLALLAIAVVARLRDPRAVAPNVGDLSEMLGTGRGRPSWRVLLIGLGVIVAWLLIAMMLVRLWVPHDCHLLRAQLGSERAAVGADHRPAAPATSAKRHRGHVRNPARQHDPDVAVDRRPDPPSCRGGGGVRPRPGTARRRSPRIRGLRRPLRNRWCGPPNSDWPRWPTSAEIHARPSSRATPRWNVSSPTFPAPFPRSSTPQPRCWPARSDNMRCRPTTPCSWLTSSPRPGSAPT